ncbi:MAG: PSK operon transcription factor [Chloroflexi bacterium]|nr:PSK operon transcription factor [Chloroflexota bacterium]
MALNIKNEETHRLVRELAASTGESLTEAVTIAVRERLERVRSIDAEIEDVLDLVDRIRARVPPDFFDVDLDELLYDEDGLPK